MITLSAPGHDAAMPLLAVSEKECRCMHMFFEPVLLQCHNILPEHQIPICIRLISSAKPSPDPHTYQHDITDSMNHMSCGVIDRCHSTIFV